MAGTEQVVTTSVFYTKLIYTKLK